MFEQHAAKAPNVIERRLSFLYPSLRRVNKVITIKREFLAFFVVVVPFVLHWHPWWIDVCENLGGNSATIMLIRHVKRHDIGISLEFWFCVGVCVGRWEGMQKESLTHARSLQECLLHREELACREKTHSLLLCSAWTPQQHTHYHFLLGTHRVTAVCEEEVPVLFINQSPLAASVLQSFSWFKWIFNKSNTEYLQLPALFVICHTGAQRWKGEDISAFMLKMHLSKEFFFILYIC